jgi:hypothetical protein
MNEREARQRMDHMTDREYAAWRSLDGRRVAGLVLLLGMYGNKRAAITADHPMEGPDCTVTVNLPEFEVGEGEFFVRRQLREDRPRLLAGLEAYASPTGRMLPSGRVEEYAEVWRLTMT